MSQIGSTTVAIDSINSWNTINKRKKNRPNYKNLATAGTTSPLKDLKVTIDNKIAQTRADITAQLSDHKSILDKNFADNSGGTADDLQISQPSKESDKQPTRCNQELYEALAADLNRLKVDLLSQVSTLHSELLQVLEFSAKFEDKLDELEQYSRRECLLLHGVPETHPGQDLDETTLALLNAELGLKLTISDISRLHRLGKPSSRISGQPNHNRPRPIIIKFATYRAREQVFKNKSKLKGKPHAVSESLMHTRQKLLAKLKETIPKNNIWTQDGTIIVLLQDNKRLYVQNLNTMNEALRMWNNSQ